MAKSEPKPGLWVSEYEHALSKAESLKAEGWMWFWKDSNGPMALKCAQREMCWRKRAAFYKPHGV